MDSSVTVSLVNIRISIFEFSGIRPVFYSDQARKLNSLDHLFGTKKR